MSIQGGELVSFRVLTADSRTHKRTKAPARHHCQQWATASGLCVFVLCVSFLSQLSSLLPSNGTTRSRREEQYATNRAQEGISGRVARERTLDRVSQRAVRQVLRQPGTERKSFCSRAAGRKERAVSVRDEGKSGAKASTASLCLCTSRRWHSSLGRSPELSSERLPVRRQQCWSQSFDVQSPLNAVPISLAL